MKEIKILPYQTVDNYPRNNFDNSLNPLFKQAVDRHLQIVLSSDSSLQRMASWLELEQEIKELFLVYDRQVKLEQENRKYFLKIFYKMLQQKNISGQDIVALMQLLRIYPAKEAAYVLHFFNLAYLDYNIEEWIKDFPKVNVF